MDTIWTDQGGWIRVDGPIGHVALIWSLCGLQGILNGNDLCLTINPSP